MNNRLSRWTRVLYAAGSFGGNAINRSRDLWLLFFYLGDGEAVRHGSPWLVGIALVVVRLLEAFDDPLIGHWSDATRTRLGRRIPYILLATPFMAVSFVFLWMPPDPSESVRNVLYLFGTLTMFHFFSTLASGPLEALLPEIARRPEDRLSISSWQVIFGVGGTVLALVGSGPLIDHFGFGAMAVIVAAATMASRYMALAGIWRPSLASAAAAAEAPREPSLRRSIAGCMRNRQFLWFLPSQVLYSLGMQMMTAILPFFVTGILGYAKPGMMVSVITGTAVGTLLLVLPVIMHQARTRSKRVVYGWGMLFASLYFPLLFFVGFIPGIPGEAQIIMFAALLGLPLAPVNTFPNAMIADICDYDELSTGLRREATFYSLHATIEKTAGALAPALLTGLLMLGHSHDDPLGIRLVGPFAGLLTLAGYLCFRRYWLPDSVTAESVAAAQAQQAQLRPAHALSR
jgi:GPH family glycoside/pentoside/hexuronide:cation symporter